jgi:hypothetical protein
MAGRPIRGTLSGYQLWALDKYRQANGMTEGEALAAIILRWLDTDDRQFLAELGISRQAFKGADIVPMSRKRKNARSEPT